jgi:hypothetical protein
MAMRGASINITLDECIWFPVARVLVLEWDSIYPKVTQMESLVVIKGKHHTITFKKGESDSSREVRFGQLYLQQDAPEGYKSIEVWYYPMWSTDWVKANMK